jgi:hypothetical protein
MDEYGWTHCLAMKAETKTNGKKSENCTNFVDRPRKSDQHFCTTKIKDKAAAVKLKNSQPLKTKTQSRSVECPIQRLIF